MKILLKLLLAIGILVSVSACATLELKIDPNATDIVFKNVNLISMTGENVTPNQSVYISNGIIKQIGTFEELDFPVDTEIITADGKYLIPGFNDMHIHTDAEEYMSLYLANGVTTVRNMWGEPKHLELKRKLETGELLGPRFYTAGPLTDGDGGFWEGSTILTDPDKVEEYVLQVIKDGYDYIKVYNELTPEVFFKIMEIADKHDIPVVGHVPERVDINDAINAGMVSIEHLHGYDVDKSLDELKETIELTVQSGVWNCPTFIVMQKGTQLTNKHKMPEEFTAELNPRLKYVHPNEMEFWGYFWGWDGKVPQTQAVVKALHQAGAGMVSGTDQGNPYVLAGFSLHDEFVLMQEAGLSPYEVLLTTTVNPAKMLGIEDKAGTIEVEKNADLVLLDQNPLDDIKNTTTILGVMAQGTWLDSSTINNRLAEIADYFNMDEDEEDNEESVVFTSKEKTEIFNGDFSNGHAEWGPDDSYGGKADFTVIDEVMVIDIKKPGFKNWSIGLYSEKIPLHKTDIVKVSFDIKADKDTVISSNMGLPRYPYSIFGETGDIQIAGGADWQTVTYEYTVYNKESNSQLAFALGDSAAATVYIDNVVVEVIGTNDFINENR